MKHNRPFDVLDDIARDTIPEDTDLVPQVAARLNNGSPMMSLRTRPLIAVLIAVLVLLALSGAAYALGRALGYFPGLGLVPQDGQFRVLSGPVSQTREGVTVTITQAISNADQMSVALKVEDVPAGKQSFETLPGSNSCRSYPDSYPTLRFPNGESMKVSSAEIHPVIGGYTATYKFAPVPLNTAEATLFIPCVQGASAPGILPENWELSMNLVPAAPELALTVVPVKIVPTLQAASEPSPAAATGSAPAVDTTDRLSVTQVFDTGTDYILIGTFSPPASHPDEKGLYALDDISLRDGNQQLIDDQEFPPDLDLTPYLAGASGRQLWAIKFAKGFTPPLHLTYRTLYLYSPLPQDAYTFDFDAGPNPQAGQEWNLDREFKLSGHAVTLKGITAGANSYTFFFQTDDEQVDSLGIDDRDAVQITGYTPTSFAASGGGSLGQWTVTKVYSELPKGNLRVVLSRLYLIGTYQDWTMDWQP